MASTHKAELARHTRVAPGAWSPVRRGNRQTKQRNRIPIHLWLGIILIGLVLLGALVSLVIKVNPNLIHSSARLVSPTFKFPFGTDQLGRDVFSRVLRGAQFALWLSISATLLSVVAGVALGLLSGYQGGWVDVILSRLMDGLLAFPGLLLAIVLAARLGPSLRTTILALGIMGVPSFFRLTRSGTFTIKNAGYVLSSQSIGASRMRILLRHILPNLSSTLLVFITLRLGTMVLAGSGLSFIGLGVQPPDADWGAMLASSKSLLGKAWWLAVFPGLAITMTVLGFNMLGDGLRDFTSVK